MFELEDCKKQLCTFHETFAKSIKAKDPIHWYPIDRKESTRLLKSYINHHPYAKKFISELQTYLEEMHVMPRTNEIVIKAKGKERAFGAGHIDWLTPEKKIWNHADKQSQFAHYKKLNMHKRPGAFIDLDLSTDEILGDLEDPNRNDQPWSVRGMVVGDVQSGKTANYVGLAAKALDSGYKMIIVLAGIHNALRSQTQLRLEQSILHGAQRAGPEVKKPVFLTQMPEYHPLGPDGIRKVKNGNDFNGQKKIPFTNHDPVVLVTKKRVPILKEILKWLAGQKGIESTKEKFEWDSKSWSAADIEQFPKYKLTCDKSLLIIDDECDTASIDVGKRAKGNKAQADMTEEELLDFQETDPSKTNLLIRRILSCFEKKAYVGYTATPIANVMIDYTSVKSGGDEADLFPRDFIKLLKRYPNYIGPEDVFGTAEKEVHQDDNIVTLSENIDKNEKHQVKWVYDYRNDWDKEWGGDEERDIEYRKEAKIKKGEVEGWLPLYHEITQVPMYKNINQLPPSLKEAINIYLINIAMRFYRNLKIYKPEHNSMLIHVSRFKTVQQLVHSQVSEYLKNIKQILTIETDENKKKQIKNEFEKIWLEKVRKKIDFKKYPEDLKMTFKLLWSKIVSLTTDEENNIDILQINSLTDDSLDYERKNIEGKAWNIIVIGGAAISRGITLEGLNISYFLRLAKIPTSDTLIQMGRWFGYRDGYEDLYRVYCPKQLHILFRQFSFTMEYARNVFERMSLKRFSPREYALEIPSFPGWNIIAKNKGRDMGQVVEPFASIKGNHHQATKTFKHNEIRLHNINSAKVLIKSIEKNFETEKSLNTYYEKHNIYFPNKLKERLDRNLSLDEIKKILENQNYSKPNVSKAFFWKNIETDLIIKYLNNFKMPRTTEHWTPQTLSFKIKNLNETFKEQLKWDVGIFSVNEDPKKLPLFKFDTDIIVPAQQRTPNKTPRHPDEFLVSTLSSRNARFMGITQEEFNSAINEWLELYKLKETILTTNLNKENINYLPAGFDKSITDNKKNGLLVLYPYTTKFIHEKDYSDNCTYVGWEIFIPPTLTNENSIAQYYNLNYNRVRRDQYAESIRESLKRSDYEVAS